MPGCPASAGVDRFKWVEPSSSLDNILPPVEAVAFALAEVAEVVSPLTHTSAIPASSPPLYLSHCSLVI